MAKKNPLTNPPAGSSSGRDMVQKPANEGGSGTDFVQSPKGSKAKGRGTDFVAQQRSQPQGRKAGGPSAHQCEESVPEGGTMTPIALSNQLAPGNGGQQNLRPEGGSSMSPKPFKVH
jgi:hypothetical protein